MAAKRITISMAEEAASEMTQPIKDHIALLRRKASNIIKAEYLKIPKYAYLEEVDAKYPGFLDRTRNAKMTYMTYKSIGDAILKCGNMRVLKKEYPEAYKVLEAYDTESPKSKTNTALQLPLESINKILSKYEKDN